MAVQDDAFYLFFAMPWLLHRLLLPPSTTHSSHFTVAFRCPAPGSPPFLAPAVMVVDFLPQGTRDFREVCQQFRSRLRTVLSDPKLSSLVMEGAGAAACAEEAEGPAPQPGGQGRAGSQQGASGHQQARSGKTAPGLSTSG